MTSKPGYTCDKFKQQHLKVAVELSHVTISPIKDKYKYLHNAICMLLTPHKISELDS